MQTVNFQKKDPILQTKQNIIKNKKMKQTSRLNLKSKLTCMNQKHKNEQIKIVCLSEQCRQCPFLCSVCLTQFNHEKCKYKLITIKELQKKQLWKMDNWPTRPDHYEIKQKLRKFDDLVELDELIERITINLKQKMTKAIDQLKNNAKARYRLLIEKRQFDIEPLRQLYFEAYNVEQPFKIVNDVLNWKRNIYQGIQALQQFKQNQTRTLAIKELDILLENGKFPLIPTQQIADRAFNVILYELQNLPKEIFGQKVVTNTLQFTKQHIEDDDGIYEGEVVDGKKHGTGKYFFKNGNLYEGQTYKGKMQGKGKYTWANKNVYEGTFVQDKMNGFGKLIFANGDAYEGQFVNNRACGNGKMVAHTGDAYEGQFMNNLKQGKGKQYLKNGNIYEGQFFEGKWHGRGKIFFPDATVQEGVWLQNQKQ